MNALPHVAGSPSKAWLRSLPTTVILPAVAWLVFGLFVALVDEKAATFALGIFAALVSLPVHLLAYAFTGLPLFHAAWRHPESWIWTYWLALPVGTLLGALAFHLFLVVMQRGGWWQFQPSALLIGAFYGLWTALCARRFRPVASTSLIARATADPLP